MTEETDKDRQLERDALAEVVGELIDENGPLDEDEIAQYADEWR